jgi:hypothetical protein
MFSAKKLQCFVLLMVILPVFTSSMIAEVHADVTSWSIETVLPEVITSSWGDYPSVGTSLALDASGYPHISYCETENGVNYVFYLKYAQWTGSEWDRTYIDIDSAFAYDPSLALDSSDYPHISYQVKEVWWGGNLLYARWTGSEWEITTIDSGGDVGYHSSLALDSSGYPHISYQEIHPEIDGNLKYARWTGSTWSINLVDSGGDVGNYTSLALDAYGYPHISYYDGDYGALKYARWTGTQWNLEIVDTDGNVGFDTSLALDATSHPHISYYDDATDDLKYARWTGSEWEITTIDSGGGVGRYSSLALDAYGHPHISYYDSGSVDPKLELKYAFSPYEYFSDVEVVSIEGSGDDFYDGVMVAMDVDTTFSGTLDVTVFAWLNDTFGSYVGYDSSTWSILDRVTEYGENIFLYVPPGSTAGVYEVELYLHDGDMNREDSYTQEVYLYPPDSYPIIDSCNPSGTPKDSFELEESIYVTGTDFAPSTSYAVYVVVDTMWIDGMAIPSRVADTITTITSNTGGTVEVTAVWSSTLALGLYDVVVDVNGNGVYDWGADVLDDSDIEVTAGVEVIPEFTIAMLVPILAGISLIAVIVKKRLLPS